MTFDYRAGGPVGRGNVSGFQHGRRRVEYLPLGEVAQADVNPKRHHGHGIAASIQRFGLAELPLVDERTGRLVAGHGRLAQAQAMYDTGQTPPDGVRVDDGGGWLLPVIRGWSSRSDAEASAYLVASNQLTIAGGWDEVELVDILGDLAELGLLELTGFTEDDRAALAAGQQVPGLDAFRSFDDWDFDDDGSGAGDGHDVTCPGCGHAFRHPPVLA